MKYTIITPTYGEHFKYVAQYLNSVAKYSLNSDNIIFVFIVEAQDVEGLKKITKAYEALVSIHMPNMSR